MTRLQIAYTLSSNAYELDMTDLEINNLVKISRLSWSAQNHYLPFAL